MSARTAVSVGDAQAQNMRSEPRSALDLLVVAAVCALDDTGGFRQRGSAGVILASMYGCHADTMVVMVCMAAMLYVCMAAMLPCAYG